MLELFYAAGLRRSELTRLRVFDLDVELRLTLAVRQGKRRKDRMIPTGERAAAWAARYLNDIRPKLAVEPDDGILFLTVDGTIFSQDRLTGLVSDYVKRSGLGKPGACHLFRQTMATLMLEGGADIRFIQQMLGHADISTTQIYTQVSLRQLRAIHAATHPGAQNTSRRHRPEASSAPGPPAHHARCLTTGPPRDRTAGIPGSTVPRIPAEDLGEGVRAAAASLSSSAQREIPSGSEAVSDVRPTTASGPHPFFVAAVLGVPRHHQRSGSRTARSRHTLAPRRLLGRSTEQL